jgi:hypothetical protein
MEEDHIKTDSSEKYNKFKKKRIITEKNLQTTKNRV